MPTVLLYQWPKINEKLTAVILNVFIQYSNFKNIDFSMSLKKGLYPFLSPTADIKHDLDRDLDIPWSWAILKLLDYFLLTMTTSP